RGREAAAARKEEEALQQQPQTPQRGPAAGQRSAARRGPAAGLLTPIERTGIILDPCQLTWQVTFDQHRGDTMSDAVNMMDRLSIDPSQGLQFGVYSLGDHLPDPVAGTRVSAEERIREFIGYAEAAEDAGFDFVSLGESHQEYFAAQAHAVILGAIAQATKSIRIGSTSTILSTSDPVRVFENFATIDLISGGRAELVAGRASRVGLFELLGYDLRDYEELFEEKFDLLQKINQEREITWSGQFRAPLNNAEVLPRPAQESLPIWRAVGGAPASAIKAGLAGVPMVMAHLGGTTSVFKTTVDSYRQAA